ncbi:AAA family ATPase [Enterococcus hulanensis]|uniref:AAA family ATPase n=1 Tax=Enterococcus hulanensis TaxID=2559929 RepID=UPI0028914CEC|nr:AAA family ATPase [Enterococcus hulanensis]MDT2659250.1 AAA family ATPase [Enterococcus hulanensis]
MRFYLSDAKVTEDTQFPLFVLSKDFWNDSGYVTGFTLKYFDNFEKYENGRYYHIGLLKIGKKGMMHDDSKAYLKDEVHTSMPKEFFDELNEDYFSLGQDLSYYTNIVRQFDEEKREKIFTALKDVAFNESAFDIASGERVFKSSLLRNLSKFTVENEYRNLIYGNEVKPSNYELELVIEREVNETPFKIAVVPNSLPQTSLHALIGRNGVGKSFFFKSLVANLSNNTEIDDEMALDFFSNIKGIEDISSILAIDFSIFDSTMPKKSINADPLNNKLRYTFVGFPFKNQYSQVDYEEIRKRYEDLKIFKKTKSIEDELIIEFRDLSLMILKRENQLVLLNKVLKIVESDPMFKDNKVDEWFLNSSEDLEKKRLKDFYRLSSGHKICLLMLLEMVLNIEINSLVLIDEPELHLHPPLLSSLIKAVNYLLVTKNAIGLVATHSPVVTQEISSNCVWIMEREMREIKIKRPKMKTFGANINDITREVFSLEVKRSGYEALIEKVMRESISINEVFEKFDNQLSDNAKLLVASTWEILENE